jgi:hypothetical protein
MKDGIQMQSGLGKVSNESRKDQDMFGVMSLARVTKIYHKTNTADVTLVRTNNRIRGSNKTEGRFSCRILNSNSGYDEKNQLSYGVVEPITEGQLVVITFLDGLKNQPVIVASMHYPDNENTVSAAKFPLEPEDSTIDLREYRKYLKVFPTQDYFKVNAVGDLELALHSKSFLTWTEAEVSDFSILHGGTDFSNLSEKNKVDGSTLSMPKDYVDPFGNDYNTYCKPKNLLLVLRDNEDDELTSWTKIYADMTINKGLIRVSREPRDGTLSFFEIGAKGSLRLRRQINSEKLDDVGTEEKKPIYSEVIIEENGHTTITDSRGAEIKLIDGKVIINGLEVVINGINFPTHTHTCPMCGETSGPH